MDALKLIQAILRCDYDEASSSLSAGVRLSQKHNGVYLLTYASVYCKNEVLTKLLQYNPSQEEKDVSLLMAAKFGRYDNVLSLVKAGANVNSRDNLGLNVLSCAAEGGNDKLIVYLIKVLRLNIEFQDYLGRTPLILASSYGNIESVKTLVALGADVHYITDQGRRALEYAESLEQEEVIDYLRRVMHEEI